MENIAANTSTVNKSLVDCLSFEEETAADTTANVGLAAQSCCQDEWEVTSALPCRQPMAAEDTC